ncbi:hypothetical protein HOY82DRAFT_629784 [Tuber indicum]|nr:hypothetical protein HOY82DRAFT_629784 [Tuber indicum]
MAPLPLAAPGGTDVLNNILSSLSSFFKSKSRPSTSNGEREEMLEPTEHVTFSPESPRPERGGVWRAPPLFGLGIPKPERGEDLPKATAMFPPEPRPAEIESIWKTAGFGSTDELQELTSNPWNNFRKRSLQDQESPAITVDMTGMGVSMQELGNCRLTMTQEVSLLIFTWIAAMFICGMIVWVMAKIERKLHRLMERGVIGFGEKKGWNRALHCVGYGSVITAIIAMLLMLIAVMLSLKDLLGGAVWGA